MNCPYCGNQVAEGSAFCGNCGAKLDAQASPAAQTPPPPIEPASTEPVAPPPVEPAPAFAPVEPPAFTPPPAPVPAKKSNRNLIIVIVILVLVALCCCCFILLAMVGPFTALLDPRVWSSFLTPTPRLR